ncbi:MAG: serine/threonine-protein kinase [Cyanobacteriota bacterium]
MSSNPKWRFWKTNRSPTPTQRTKTQSKTGTSTTGTFERWLKSTGWGHLLVGVWALSGGIATTLNWGLVQSMERQTQAFFFQLRGPIAAPNNIVILAIDEDSLAQEQFYQAEPQNLAFLEPIQKWPWKREAYAIAIDRIMEAGAKAVGVDLLFDRASNYGQADDEALRQVLQKHRGRVTLGASYEDDETRQGGVTRLLQPYSFFQTNPMSVGSINYTLEPNGRIHRHGSVFPKLLAQQYSDPELARVFYETTATVPSFDEAVLKAAGVKYSKPKGDNIFFYGPAGTFEVIPFWYVLDPNNWNTFLEKGEYFKDKIVLIGPTATILQDFHPTPFSESWVYPELMTGIEIHANAIATLLQGRSIAQAIPNPVPRGLFVFIGVIGTGFLITRIKNLPIRLIFAGGVVLAWVGISYTLFTYERLILPTAVPVVAIALSSLSYGTVGSIRDYFSNLRIRRTLKHYSSSPIVQEIISQDDAFQGLLEEREIELLKTKLAGRYKIIKPLSAGGFGATYIAEDTQRPGQPICVVKQLRPASNNPKHWELARRLFNTEAETLEKLGKHDQIPQLLAYFEEGEEFYLAQEFIAGSPLTKELPLIVPLSEAKVIDILQDVLSILKFVHSYGMIHRDIKPDNIIRRQSDGKLVLIDFGAVKAIRNQLAEDEQPSDVTVGIGTKGYMPNEQAMGSPKFNSDIYALGMIAIQALTLTHPANLPENPKTGEVRWEDKAQVSSELAIILKKMVRYNSRDRYQSATEVLQALQHLIAASHPNSSNRSRVKEKPKTHSSSLPNTPASTQLGWDASTPQDAEEGTQIWADSSTPEDAEEGTQIWADSSTPEDAEEETQIWADSSTPQDAEESTKLWSESSTPQDPQE